MAVKARMRCNSIIELGENRTVQFTAHVDSDPENPNKSWSKWTPAGSLSLTISNPDAYDQFEAGKLYELTFEPVE